MLNEYEKLQYQRAQENFFETQRKKSGLPEKDKRLFDQLEKVKIGRYNTTCYVMSMIAEVYQNNAIDAFDTIFKLGFMKGQRAERARSRKAGEKKCQE